jgi:glutamate-1-semialdehyde 2,1-aminomutase
MTPAAYRRMLAAAQRLEQGLLVVIGEAALAWTVTRLGARMELQFCTETPRNAAQARAAMDVQLETALQLYLLNRGIVVTPFHNMLLVPPMASDDDIDAVVASVRAFVAELRS